MLESHLSTSALKKGANFDSCTLQGSSKYNFTERKTEVCRAWCCTPIILPVLRRLRHQGSEFTVIYEYTGITAMFNRRALDSGLECCSMVEHVCLSDIFPGFNPYCCNHNHHQLGSRSSALGKLLPIFAK